MRRTLLAAARYEFRMAARRRLVWLAVLPLLAIAVLLQVVSPEMARLHGAARMGSWALSANLLVLVGVGVVLADRFAGSARRGLHELLETTPVGVWPRLAGTLAGALAAALAPVAAVLLGAGIVAACTGDLLAPVWAVAALVTVTLPSALVLTAVTATAGLVLPLALTRVLAVGGWFWATLLNTRLVPVPTITGTLLSPLGDYPAAGWLHTPALWAGEGAFLSPPAGPLPALLNVLVAVAVTAACLAVATRLARTRGLRRAH